MENTTSPKNDSSVRENEVSYIAQRRYLWLPVGLGVVLLLVLGLLIGTVVHTRQPGLKSAAAFGRPMMRQEMLGGVRPLGQMGTGRNRTIGAVSKIDGSNITLHTSGQDLTVVVSADTSIYKNHVIAKQSDIAVGQALLVHGAPNSSGQIAAAQIVIE